MPKFDHKHVLVQHVRRGSRRVATFVACVNPSGRVAIGFSKCRMNADEFNPDFGVEIAYNRAMKNVAFEVDKGSYEVPPMIPKSIVNDYLAMLDRTQRYFFKGTAQKWQKATLLLS